MEIIEVFLKTSYYESTGSEEGYELYGGLTIKGIERKIRLGAKLGGVIKDQLGRSKALFRLDGNIKRSDWGLKWNILLSEPNLLISDEVRIVCEVQLIRPC